MIMTSISFVKCNDDELNPNQSQEGKKKMIYSSKNNYKLRSWIKIVTHLAPCDKI